MYTQKTHTIAHNLCVKLPRVRTRKHLLFTKVTIITIIIKKKKLEGGFMESSYKKLAKLKEETIFILKTKKRNLEEQLHDENGKVNTIVAFALRQLQELIELYEIE